MAEPGDRNRNEQELIRKTKKRGNGSNQYVWVLRCHADCAGTAPDYGANGCDFHERKCPECQGGAKGLPID